MGGSSTSSLTLKLPQLFGGSSPIFRRCPWEISATGSTPRVYQPTFAQRVDGRRGWQTSTVVRIVENPVYLGTAAYGRRDTNKKWRQSDEWLTIAVPSLVDR